MVTVKLGKDGGVELVDKKSTVRLVSNQILLDGKTYSDPGEYEAVGVELVRGTNSALIVWEQLQIVFVFSLQAPTNFERAQFASCDALIFSPSLEELTKANGSVVIDEYDPKVLLVPKATNVEASFLSSLKLQDANALKLSVATLPTEGRDAYQLV